MCSERLPVALVHIRGSLLTFDHWSHQATNTCRSTASENEESERKMRPIFKNQCIRMFIWNEPKLANFIWFHSVFHKRYFTLHPNERDVNPTNVIFNGYSQQSQYFWNESLSLFHLFTFFSCLSHLGDPLCACCVISRIEFKPISIVLCLSVGQLLLLKCKIVDKILREHFWKITIGSFVMWNRFMHCMSYVWSATPFVYCFHWPTSVRKGSSIFIIHVRLNTKKWNRKF